MTDQGLSLRPEDAVEGAAVAPDGNYEVAESMAVIFDYAGKAPASTAIRLKLVGDDGTEFVQHYSAGDPTRIVPSEDGKMLVPLSDAVKGINKSTNAFVLLSNMVNAGFPVNKVGSDVSVFAGMYGTFQQVPEPERKSLKREGDTRVRMIPVPVKIIRLPWDKKGGKAPAKAAPAKAAGKVKTAAVEEPEDEPLQKAVDLVKKLVEEKGSVTRQQVGIAAFKLKDPQRDPIAKAVFSAELLGALASEGYTIDGETISAGE